MFGLPPSEPVRQTRADSSAASDTDATRAPAKAGYRFDDQAITPKGRMKHLRTAQIAIARAQPYPNVPPSI